MIASLFLFSAIVVAAFAALFYLTLSSVEFRNGIMRNFASTRYLPHATLPGPPILPFLGTFFLSLNYLKTGLIHIGNHEMLVKSSKDGLLLIQHLVLGKKFVMTGDPEICKLILTKGVRSDFFQSLGVNLVTYALFMMPTDNVWKNHRKGIQPGFGPSHLRHTFVVTNDSAKDLVSGLNAKLAASKAQDKPLVLDVLEILSSLTLDVLAKVAFSSDFGCLTYILENEHTSTEFRYLGQILEIINKRALAPKPLWPFFKLSEKDTAEVKLRVHAYVQRLLSQRVERNAKGGESKGSRELDVMDRLLAQDESGTGRFSDQEIVDELIAFMLAGQDTTANTMTWFLLELSRHPDLAEELEAEIDAFYEANCVNDKITISDTNFETLQAQCPKLDAFFKEVQRFHPVVGAVGRIMPDGEIDLGGHIVDTRNTVFTIHIRGLHFNERYWKNPYEFDPKRWDEPPAPGAFLPFGDGPHNCIGRKMAVIEAMTVLATLVRQFRFKLIPGQHLLGKVRTGVTLIFSLVTVSPDCDYLWS
ncbi:cytochrome P450 [Cladochytrium replicatum]|nr:cytochrome P450 [Cladochytrium replicatum]